MTRNSELDNAVAVVTGAQQGIGFAIVRLMLQAGAHVVANWQDNEYPLLSLAEEQDSSTLSTVHGDVRDENDVANLFAAADAFGGANILVNNAAIFPRVAFLDMTDAHWDEVMDVNLKGSFRCARQFARRCVDAKRGGRIINLSSGAAFRSSPRGVHYVASKAGVVGMTRALSLELAPYDIRVNAIAPGLTNTAQPRYGMTEEELVAAARENPLGRIADPDDIAAMVMFLCSAGAAHITGQTLHVNGGQYLT